MRNPLEPRAPSVRRIRYRGVILVALGLAAAGVLIAKRGHLDPAVDPMPLIALGILLVAACAVIAAPATGEPSEFGESPAAARRSRIGTSRPSRTARIMICLFGFAVLLVVVNGDHMKSVLDNGATIGSGGSESDLLGLLSLLMLAAVFLVGVKIFLTDAE
jgi:hypothetical protein